MTSRTASVVRVGADAVAEAFVRHGIQRIHVFPGGTIAPVFEAALARGIDIFTARHEQGAGYAALAAARLRGRPEVAMVTSGPGVTNLLTPVADAYFDSTPLVVLTGQVGAGDMRGERPIRQRGFQEVDTVALMRPITKQQLLPRRPEEVGEAIDQAFRVSAAGRPGPVLVDLPMNVQRGELSETAPTPSRGPAPNLTPPRGPTPNFTTQRGPTPTPTPSREPTPTPIEPDTPRLDGQAPARPDARQPAASLLDAAAECLLRARQPVIIAGQGVLLARAQEELRSLAESRGIPVSHSLLGLGALPSDHPLALGYHGHTGNQYAGLAIHEADMVLVLGSRLDVRQTGSLPERFAPAAKIVRVELDPAELEHSRVRCDVALPGDVRRALVGLLGRLHDSPPAELSAWHRQIAGWREEFALRWETDGPLKPQPIVLAANRLTAGEEVVCVTGVGSHQQWVARHFDLDFPRRPLLTSGGHGAMGYDLPTAVGAQLARPHAKVLCFVGDGSLQINIQELASVVERDLPLKIVVLDNHRLGIVSQFQLQNWDDDPTCGGKWNPDFAALARAYGIPSRTLLRAEEIDHVLAPMLAAPGPALVHCLIDPAEDVTPMLLAGQTMNRMWPYGS
jgi:acetolactate synthase I/II/III large subunit